MFTLVSYDANNVHKTDKTKDYHDVYDRFHLNLPQDVIPLLDRGENDNFHGDGYHLMIFQFSPAGQENLMKQRFFASWSQLPMDSALQDKLDSLLQMDGLTGWVDLEGMQGFYIILSKNYSYVISDQNNIGKQKQNMDEAFNMNDDLWRNISFAVLDTYHHQLIIYTWDS